MLVTVSVSDLFHQAIEMSGSSFARWATNELTVDATKELAKELKCDSRDSSAIKKCLKKAANEELRAAAMKIVRGFLRKSP